MKQSRTGADVREVVDDDVLELAALELIQEQRRLGINEMVDCSGHYHSHD